VPYGVCLFDLDGTLTDSKEGIVNSFRYALSRFGIEMPDEGLERFLGPALRDSFVKHFGFTDARAEEATAEYRKYYSSAGIYENKLYPGVADMLEGLKRGGVTMAVATSKTAPYAERVLRHFGIDGYFSFVSGSEFDGRRSGKKELILHALENLSDSINKTKTAVMIGDREYDITGAKQAGIKSAGVTYGYGTRAELILAGADHIVDAPEELRAVILNGAG